jgi:hypothetical protein
MNKKNNTKSLISNAYFHPIEKKRYSKYPVIDINKQRNIKNDYTKKNVYNLIIKHIKIILKIYRYLIKDDFNLNFLLNIIIYLYNNDCHIIDGANLAMTTIDKNIYGYNISENKKSSMRRNWNKVANFTKINKYVIILRDCIFKFPRKSEKDINFLNIFNGNVIWLSTKNKKLDDIYIIMISSILSLLKNKTFYYISNDNFFDHYSLINDFSCLNSKFRQLNYRYNSVKSFSIC